MPAARSTRPVVVSLTDFPSIVSVTYLTPSLRFASVAVGSTGMIGRSDALGSSRYCEARFAFCVGKARTISRDGWILRTTAT
jgi:hypothetical protein